MKQLDTKLMHPADQITVVISRIYRERIDYHFGRQHLDQRRER